MYTVRKCIQKKGGAVWTIRPEETVLAALELMAEKDVGALVVMEGDRLVGMISERDYARKVILRGKRSHETLVSEVMSCPVYTIHPDQILQDCLAIMNLRRVRHLPVVENDRVIGVISSRDVLANLVLIQEETIRFLEDTNLDR